MDSKSFCWFWWSWFNWDYFNLTHLFPIHPFPKLTVFWCFQGVEKGALVTNGLKRKWFKNLIKSLHNSHQFMSLGVGTKDGLFNRRDICGDVKFSNDRFMAFWSGPFTFARCISSLKLFLCITAFIDLFLFINCFLEKRIFFLFAVSATMFSNFILW